MKALLFLRWRQRSFCMGRDTSKGLIVARNNRAGVGKNSDHLTPRRWQPLEVTTSPSLFVSVCLWKSTCFCLESMHNDIFLLKTSEGGGEGKKNLVDIFLSFWSPQIKEIKINLANKEALNKTIYGVGILLSFWKKFHDPFARQRTIKK